MHSRLLHTEFTDTSRVHSTVTFNCVKSFFGAYAWRQMGHWIFLTKCRSLPLHFVHNSFFFVTESSVKTYLSKVSYLNLTYLKKTIQFRGSLQGETISVTITTNILISLKYYGLLRIGKTGLCAILGTEVLACSWQQWAVIVMRNTEGERTGMTKVNSYSVLNWHFTKKEIWSKCHTHTKKKLLEFLLKFREWPHVLLCHCFLEAWNSKDAPDDGRSFNLFNSLFLRF